MPPSKTQKRLESAAHIAMGFLAGLGPFMLLLERRERKQLPPENDRYPRMWISKARAGNAFSLAWTFDNYSEDDEYWAKARVIDTLRDSREYLIGQTVSWFVVVGGSIALGAWLL